MILMEKMLQEKKIEIEKLIKILEKELSGKPQGSLRVVKDRKHFSYYYYLTEEKENFPGGKYISKKDGVFIHTLAQKAYAERVLKWAKQCYTRLIKLIAVYRDNPCQTIYEDLGTARQTYVTPYVLPDETFIEQWLTEPYSGKEFHSDSAYFITEKGEKVRSKSEKIIADKFFVKGIPYKYECPIYLKGYGNVYPDFTLLNVRTRQTCYWEHFGMMDNPEYVEKAIMKIRTYEQNGIFPGKQLLLSYEMNNDLDIFEIDNLIQEYLL